MSTTNRQAAQEADRAQWRASSALQAEFRTPEAYSAYQHAVARGRVRIAPRTTISTTAEQARAEPDGAPDLQPQPVARVVPGAATLGEVLRASALRYRAGR